MTWQILLVLSVIMLMMVGLIFEWARPDLIVFTALAIFLLTGIVSPEEGLQGFSNEGMLTVALLFIIASAIQNSGIFNRIMVNVLGKKSRGTLALLRMLVPVSGLSAFLNNTPIVAMLTPVIRKWCEDRGISASKFLIPLSYATILGGMITIMGTSTTLVVHGMLLKNNNEGFSFFQIAIIGIPATLIGLLYLVTVGYKLLPNRKGREFDRTDNSKDYLAELVVEENYPFINQSVEQAGLRQLNGLFLIEIIREFEVISPVRASTLIRKGDRLIFTGEVSTIAELQNTKGLRLDPASDISIEQLINAENQVVEVVISHQSSLIGKTVKTVNFRGKYDGAVIAVHRHHERIRGKIGNIILKPGDTLLVLTGSDFNIRQNMNDFYVVTPIANPFISKANIKKGWFTMVTLVITIGLVTCGFLSMFKGMCLEVILLLLSRTITIEEAQKALQFKVLLIIASAFGVGAAITQSGAAEWIASGLVKVGQPLGTLALLYIVYFLTNLFTEFITNNAAAVMMFPIAMSVADAVHVDEIAFALIITVAASASFITPIGYQTNLIVYGPGGYHFKDYVKVGLPLSLMVMVLTVTIVKFVWIG
ncbi:di/tricarboxylate transporter [Pullulanibacillus pueri]|uniref:Sodium:sulfate symporter n=1 Tax=Pullulanibacillus pueri TaxID=1437324 RepID=A0A8J3EKR8_9BACL|nr:SLC13 family permease [Pullulanibacillus pueri]MBM7683609.1 di/tricarboxylate transporter [Pullulanibacillus pueri]GGH76536.1 sodium:sulfate symporter [Pullulanibacillus pueri]